MARIARAGAGPGIGVDYVSALGDDPFSDEMLAAWRAEGIGTDLVARLPGRLPGLHVVRNDADGERSFRSEEHTSELQSLMRISYAVFCLQKKTNTQQTLQTTYL